MRRLGTIAGTAAALLALGAGTAAAAPREPLVRITTRSGAVLVGLPVGGGRAEGTVAAPGGTDRVRVIWSGNPQEYEGGGWACGSGLPGSVVGYDADLACRTAARTRCTWSAPAPVRPGRYLLFAVATDFARRTGAAGPVTVTVV